MNNEVNNINRTAQQQAEEAVDIKTLIIKVISYWYLFVIFGFVALCCGYIYNRFSTNIYQVSSSIYLKESKMGVDAASMMTGMNFRSTGNVDNEIGILKSYMLAEKALKDLDFDVSYFQNRRFKTTELYGNNPLRVEIDYSKPQMVGLMYEIRMIDEESFELRARGENRSIYDFRKDEFLGMIAGEVEFAGEYKYGDTISNGYNTFTIVPSFYFDVDEYKKSTYMFRLNDMMSQVRMMSNFDVSKSTKESSLLVITIKGANTRKITTFLNQLCAEFIKRDLELKNVVQENTIKFIDEQLGGIQDSLHKAETDIQVFQQGNDFMDLSAQASETFSYLKEQEKRRAELDINLKYYYNIKKYLQTNLEDPQQLIAPSAVGIQDPILNTTVNKLVELFQTKSTQLITSTEMNPIVLTIDQQIVQTKKVLLENINNMINNANLTINEINANIAKLEAQVKDLPDAQRRYMGYTRKFTYSENIYNFLMQRRSEAQILRASNTPDNQVIDVARVSLAIKVAPRTMQIYLISLILGLGIPAAFIFLKDYLNTKILERKDVEKVCGFPIIGQIPQNEESNETKTMVIDSPKSPAAESFRSIRTNIDFIMHDDDRCCILVTGDMSSVGKTYISVNIASIYALYGKKTVLVGFDLRKPRLYQEFGLSNKLGVSTYLANKASLQEIVQPSGKLPSLDVICAGPVPSNPAELTASARCAEFFTELKNKYDYIIVDTPPLALVTDAFLLMKHCDVVTYVVRQGLTNKKVFASIVQDLERRHIDVKIIINGIVYSGTYGYRYSGGYGGYGYGYGYGYGHGYGHGYYGENKNHKKEGWFARLLRRRRS
ncbi:MAG: polysaccharide biosynthesis tyrosine autokinase [bacterium]|nr:polysaccharide biosynthesis tyrosine autokinase [Candidatus Limimorpha caballi]